MTVSETTTASPSPRWHRTACWLGALLPVCLGFVAHLRGPQAQAAPEKRALPSLAFNQYLIHDTSTDVRPYYAAHFRFRNNGNRTVTITELKPSCGCLSPKLEKKTYAPGERGEFTLTVDPTKEKSGQHEYYADVHYEDDVPRVARVSYKIMIPDRKLEVTPKALLFYQLADNGIETSQDVVISDYRERHLEVTGIESTSPLARAEMLGRSTDEEGNSHTRFKITVVGKVPSGTSRAIINLATDDPVFKVVQVPVLIRGPEPKVSASELPIQLDPKSLFLIANEPGPVTGKITLREISAQPLTILRTELKSAKGDVTIGPLRPSDNGPLERLRDIAVTLDFPAGTTELKALLVIETSALDQPRIEVPIVIESKRLGN